MVLALAAALVAGGCGNKEKTTTEASTEGVYLDVGGLKYQVQISRILNPSDVEDRNYLTQLPQGTLPPKADEAWFGVWMRVQNTNDNKSLPTASNFEIRDTQDNVFRPYDQTGNVFAYQAVDKLGPNEVLPLPDAPAGSGPIQGSLILFKLKNDSLQNRPLVLHIEKAGAQPAEVDLDL